MVVSMNGEQRKLMLENILLLGKFADIGPSDSLGPPLQTLTAVDFLYLVVLQEDLDSRN